jgi:hypothetical protein
VRPVIQKLPMSEVNKGARELGSWATYVVL